MSVPTKHRIISLDVPHSQFHSIKETRLIMPGATTTQTVVRPKPLKIDHADVLADYNDARADALPISRAVNRDYFMRYFSLGDPTNDPQKTSTKVSLWRLLSFSTVNERWLMIFGLLMATVSGLGMPVWLILLNRSLDELSNLSTLMGSVANDRLMDLVQGKLKDLCIAFTIVGLVSLVTGALYVSIWTYTGEKQALRIRSQYFRSIINQDAAWFDHNDREGCLFQRHLCHWLLDRCLTHECRPFSGHPSCRPRCDDNHGSY
jgi:hypothetical protein